MIKDCFNSPVLLNKDKHYGNLTNIFYLYGNTRRIKEVQNSESMDDKKKYESPSTCVIAGEPGCVICISGGKYNSPFGDQEQTW